MEHADFTVLVIIHAISIQLVYDMIGKLFIRVIIKLSFEHRFSMPTFIDNHNK